MSKIKCPNILCRSTDVVPVSTKKNFKKGKGLIGGAVGTAIGGPLVGAVGLATGFNVKKKVKFVCQKCGKVFEVKM